MRFDGNERRYNKRRDDFETLQEYNDYLEEIEDIGECKVHESLCGAPTKEFGRVDPVDPPAVCNQCTSCWRE